MESEVLHITSNNISNSLNQLQFVLIFDIWRILHATLRYEIYFIGYEDL